MRMSPDDRKNFPKLTQYVRRSLPQVTNVPKIVMARPPAKRRRSQ